jgi:hypothetical protein
VKEDSRDLPAISVNEFSMESTHYGRSSPLSFVCSRSHVCVRVCVCVFVGIYIYIYVCVCVCVCSGGMLIPCAIIYYYHNANNVVVDEDGRIQNTASLVTACVAAAALALQGIFPMREGDGPHTVFATLFFSFAFFHALSTSQLYLNSRSTVCVSAGVCMEV